MKRLSDPTKMMRSGEGIVRINFCYRVRRTVVRCRLSTRIYGKFCADTPKRSITLYLSSSDGQSYRADGVFTIDLNRCYPRKIFLGNLCSKMGTWEKVQYSYVWAYTYEYCTLISTYLNILLLEREILPSSSLSKKYKNSRSIIPYSERFFRR